MRTLLLDTNIVSYLFKRAPQCQLYEPHLQNSRLVISFITVAELYRWPIVKRWGEEKRRALEERIRNYVVIPFDVEVCKKWAEVTSIPGLNPSHSDAWIAAIALRHNIPLVTHNRKHFDRIPGLTLITEEEPSS